MGDPTYDRNTGTLQDELPVQTKPQFSVVRGGLSRNFLWPTHHVSVLILRETYPMLTLIPRSLGVHHALRQIDHQISGSSG